MKNLLITLLLLLCSQFVVLAQHYLLQSDNPNSPYGHNIEAVSLFSYYTNEGDYIIIISAEYIQVLRKTAGTDNDSIYFASEKSGEFFLDSKNKLKFIQYFDYDKDGYNDLLFSDENYNIVLSKYESENKQFGKLKKLCSIAKPNDIVYFWFKENVLLFNSFKKGKNSKSGYIVFENNSYRKYTDKKNDSEIYDVLSFGDTRIFSLWRKPNGYSISLNPKTGSIEDEIVCRNTEASMALVSTMFYNLPHIVQIRNDSVYFLKRTTDSYMSELVFSNDNAFRYVITQYDVDNNGMMDAILYSEPIGILFNEGNGSFKQQVIPVNFDLKGISVIDIDNDSDLDLIINSFSGLYLYYLADNEYILSQKIEISRYMDFYYLIDINNDGKKDLLMKSQNYDEIFWSENTGSSFSDAKTLHPEDINGVMELRNLQLN
ncbi:MAG: VCBS repeat-containing protein [Bacteroidales bacterium]|nr:VCBS repeat-containing protein [Bacteroidales bacterium]